MALQVDIILENNAFYRGSFQYVDAKDNPIPLKGYDAILEIREAPHLPIILTLTRSAGVVLDDSSGDIIIQLTEAQIRKITFLSGVYSLRLIYNNIPDVFMRGCVIRKDEHDGSIIPEDITKLNIPIGGIPNAGHSKLS